MIYDAAVIGGGVTGASVLWHLSHYECKAVLLEKCCDGALGISKANSGIVHGGFHHPVTSLKAKLEVKGIPMFDALQKELHFPFHRCGIVVAAFTEEELASCRKLFEQGKANGIGNLQWHTGESLRTLEPLLAENVLGGFVAPDGGVIEPTAYGMRLLESARLNGADLCFETKVEKGEYIDGVWHLQIAGRPDVIKARYVVNAAGLFADEVSRAFGAEEFRIVPRKGEEYLLDRESRAKPQRVLFPAPSKHSKGVLVIPTVGGTTMIGPTADMVESKDDTATSAENFRKILSLVQKIVPAVTQKDVISSFAGLRPVMENEDFYIAPSEKVPCFIQAAGIQSPGLTASPAVGEYITDLLKTAGLSLTEKTAERVMLTSLPEIRNLTDEETDRLYQENRKVTSYVCRCEKITEAEIIEAVRHGHTTLDGVKFYTRAGMGRCQGGFCQARIMEIISRESGIPLEELTKKGGASYLLAGRLGSLKVKEMKHD